jgi:hypothetical protein
VGSTPTPGTNKRKEKRVVKMYILIPEDVPLGYAMVAAAHASLAGYLKFRDTPEVAAWLDGPFRKAVCKVNAKEFENAKAVEDHVLLTESALDGREVALVFKPREEWPKMFRVLKLYRDAPLLPAVGEMSVCENRSRQ